ncbi:expressed unknown protein [Seminavis robusta]|uniref:Uncharacterized protein n=1 Tax=Seminavis robusta TaxID=568900 RepID=A0A9N8DSW7_9STRA|nr:expressed unknown protein [Seminavis robusta]|eukprot:Sro347_g122990.1 n/a (273) ;mRNA; f:49052-49870
MEEEAGISVLYRQEVLGKDVWIKFVDETGTQQFYKGVISKCLSYFPNHDTSKPLEYLHYVHFGDSDDDYYDLTDKEDTGYLRWTEEEPAATTTQPRVVTPEKAKRPAPAEATDNNDTAATTGTTNSNKPNKKIKVKLEFGTTISNIDDPDNNIINQKELENWLRNIHKSRGNPISESNVKRVMQRACDLVNGDGIGYKNWPQTVRIAAGTKVDLNTNFDALMEEGKQYERDYHERDKSNGWLFAHPIKKMTLYRDYVQVKRREKTNPTVLDG